MRPSERPQKLHRKESSTHEANTHPFASTRWVEARAVFRDGPDDWTRRMRLNGQKQGRRHRQ